MNARISGLARKPITWIITATAAAVAFTFLGVAIQYSHSEPRFQEVLAERNDLRDQRDQALEDYESERAKPPEVVTETVEVEVPDVEHERQLDEREGALDEREAELDELASGLEEREAAVTETETQVEENTFSNGIHLVGDDVSAGEYVTAGANGSNPVGCYYAFKSGTGADAEIIDNNIVEGQGRVTLEQGDVFESAHCSEWSKTT